MIQKPKGTNDIYGEDGREVTSLVGILAGLMEKYNYEYVRTPIFEATELFHRGVGETTDIVSKETYDFKDRGERDMTLRPEGTAGVVRSYIENKFYGIKPMPSKFWYYGPMYRYERPQSGRSREFYQFGVECFGSNSPALDAEVISIPVNFYSMLGLKNVTVHLNTLGDSESRENYHKALTEYFKPHLSELCEDCNDRFVRNPLRILDCKIDAGNPIMKKAPKIKDYLSDASAKYFKAVEAALDTMGITYVVDDSLVRGLDYYTETVFEISADVEGFGAQNILCGGGRYNNLVKNIGGPETPGVGFALGFERLLMALKAENITISPKASLDTYVIPLGEEQVNYCLSLVNDLRLSGFSADMDYMSRSLKSNFKQADNNNAKIIIIVGEDEVKSNELTVKNNKTKEQDKISLDYLYYYLKENIDDIDDDETLEKVEKSEEDAR